MDSPKTSPLHSQHLNLGARMVSFAGWQMPLFYTSILEEYKSCRSSAAMFDIFHMGEIVFEGDIEKSGIEYALTPYIKKIPPGRSRYGFLINESGGIDDDLLVFKIRPDKLLLVVNAACQERDYQILKGKVKEGVLLNASDNTAKIDLQGPSAGRILGEVFITGCDLSYFGFSEFDYRGRKILISRTGYTGELGYEIFAPNDLIGRIWNSFLQISKVKPAGLGARDVLRIEMGYSLWGSELKEDITPLEAGLGRFVDFRKDFSGKPVLLRQKEKGVEKTRVAFCTGSKRIPRPGYKIYSEGEEIGRVTSGTFSYFLSAGIGMGYLDSAYRRAGTEIIISGGRQKEFIAEITSLPFYKKGSLKKTPQPVINQLRGGKK